MKYLVFYFVPLFLLLISCDRNELDKFVNNQMGSEKKNEMDSIIPQKNVHVDTDTVKSSKIDLPELLLGTSVTIMNFRGKNMMGQGSGAFVGPNLVITNYHVIEGGTRWELTRSSDKKAFTAKIKKIDKLHDLCLLELLEDTVGLYLIINDNYPKIGSDVMVSGSPIGLEGTITKGNVSNVRREPPYDTELLQFSAPISPGNSGGPVVNVNGEIVGLTVATIVGEGIQNINFAVPAKYIKFLMHD